MKINRWKCLVLPLLFVVGCESNTPGGRFVGVAAVGSSAGSISHDGSGNGVLVSNPIDKNESRPNQIYAQTTESRPSRSEYQATVTRQDVLNWTNHGVRDDIIIDRVERSNSTFKLTAAEENQLRDKGVSECVIQSMRATSKR